MNMALIETRNINNVPVDGFYYEEEAWFSRNQIGSALEYADPQKAILLLHNRHKDRLDKFSLGYQFDTPAGKREGFLYSFKGVLEICRWSRQPKADMVMDAVWDMAESVMRKGYFALCPDAELYRLLGERLNAHEEIVKRTYHIVEPSTIKTSVPLATVTEERLCKRGV